MKPVAVRCVGEGLRYSMCILLVLLAALVSYGAPGPAPDYCELDCQGVNHTMCEYQEGGGPGCEGYSSGLTGDEQWMIVDLHNQLRQRVATGQDPRWNQPTSSNMMEVVWSGEVAAIAQRWADQCTSHGHDVCRRTAQEVHVGQNIAWMRGAGHQTRLEAIRYFLDKWHREAADFDGSAEQFTPSDPVLSHYSQLVWARAALLGCGFVQRTQSTAEYEFKLVCNYYPGGNFRSLEIYKRGEPCSECPPGFWCSERWPGLCAGSEAESSGADDEPGGQETPSGETDTIGEEQETLSVEKETILVEKEKLSGDESTGFGYVFTTLAFIVCSIALLNYVLYVL